MTSVQDNIVEFFASKTKKRRASNSINNPDEKKKPRHGSHNLPPFLTHFQDKNGNKYKLGNKKE